ncbi:FtsW/RodA/SpoVE family cell cycle protein [Flavobacterium orientale]|uniref:Probable peptidoglycan glycosyltransferase FtsW n=1 Tax=Flavobacterium orientale TaxID=1756020 RepID=A0A916XUR3_9FLAO|nr:putative peptidoglycan glycosyltransferase FtsW [Flavobacterium orientale]GGD13708.1 cell division protein FtsW [Flavobacterium orientale]
MKTILKHIKGDKVIWALVALLALFSFMPVFSASSNLAYAGHGTGNTLGYLVKHLIHVSLGFFVIYQIHRIPYHYYRSISRFLLPFIWILLAYTLFFGVEKGNARRWVEIGGISLQPSTFAFIILMVFVARYLSKTHKEPITFKSSFVDLWIPVGLTLILILPANFSTAAFMFLMVSMLVFIGKYPLKYLGIIFASGLLLLISFVGVAKVLKAVNPDKVPHIFERVETWENRITRYSDNSVKDPDEVYQIERAKTAIATGGLYGLGPGKSVQKNFLPQSSSDFIYAVIVEEFGLAGGFTIIGIYLLLLFRIIVTAQKTNTLFGRLVVVGLGFPIVFQAMINMGVAVELLPTTGQTLPLISSGGSSIWVTCLAIGIILNVTKKDEEIAAENAEKNKRDAALQRIIDKQIKDEEESGLPSENESIKDTSNEDNPMNVVLNK